MCGLFGFIANHEGEVGNVNRIVKAALRTEARGPQAWGVAWIDTQGRLSMYKRQGRISYSVKLLREIANDAVMLVGHCRWATHGSPSDNITNHPHPCDGGWLVHNGVIGRAESMVEDMGLRPVTQCDSEIFSLIATSERGAMWQRLGTALEYAQAYDGGRPAHALGWIGNRPSQVVLCRAGKPLDYKMTPRGLYFATDLLEGELFSDNTAISFRYVDGELAMESNDLAIERVVDTNVVY